MDNTSWRHFKSTRSIGILVAATLMHCGTSSLATEKPTLAGQNVSMIIGIGVGGGYDAWGRMLASHIGRHLPGNPTIVPRNMPGGGSIVATNYIYNVAPKDGTAIAIITRDAILAPISGVASVKFDPKKISWLGTPTGETSVCISFNGKDTQVKSVADLYQSELIVGSTGPGSGSYSYPTALKSLLGLKFKIVSGYPSSSNIFLSIERGELGGICESFASINRKKPTWISDKTVNVLFQGGVNPLPELKGVPTVFDLANTPETRQAVEFLYAGQKLGRPFLAPPDLSPAVLTMLRDAFDATMKDPLFVAEVRKTGDDLDPLSGSRLAAVITEIYNTPQSTVERIKDLIK